MHNFRFNVYLYIVKSRDVALYSQKQERSIKDVFSQTTLFFFIVVIVETKTLIRLGN